MAVHLFIGANHVGKSHLMLYTAKFLTNAGQKVIVLDSTSSQGILRFFHINPEIEKPHTSKILREGFDILGSYQMDTISEITEDAYQVVLIEAGPDCAIPLLKIAQSIFLVQNFDHGVLMENKEMLRKLQKERDEKSLEKTWLIYNQTVKCKFKADYGVQTLGFKPKGTIEVPFHEGDYKASLDNKMDGKLTLKRFSAEHNSAIYEISNTITTLPKDNKSLKKLLV